VFDSSENEIYIFFGRKEYATRKENEAGLSTSGGVLTGNMIRRCRRPAGRDGESVSTAAPSFAAAERVTNRRNGGGRCALGAWVGFPGGGGAPSGELGCE